MRFAVVVVGGVVVVVGGVVVVVVVVGVVVVVVAFFSHPEKNASQGILKSQLESLRKCKQIEPIQKKNVHL